MVLRWRLWRLAAVSLASCTSEPLPPLQGCAGFDYRPIVRATGIADLPQLEPILSYTAAFDENGQGSRQLDVVLHWGGVFNSLHPSAAVALDDDGTQYCPQLRFTVAIGGIERGQAGGDWGCYGPSGAACVAPALHWPSLSAGPDTVLVISDASARIELPIGDLLADRTATPVGGDWQFRAGQRASWQWSPASDLVELPFGNGSITLPCPTCPGGATNELLRLDRSAETFEMTMPDTVGTGSISITMGSTLMDRTKYFLTSTQTVFHAATIVAP